jgi:uncharacterized protein YggU (UPF0235/DUF167 family)
VLFESMEPFQRHGADLLLYIRAVPRSRKEGMGSVVADGHGRHRLKIAVHAVPEDGQANLAICRLVAGELDVASSRVQLIQGPSQRDKTLLIQACSQAVEERLRRLCLGS